MLGLPLYGYVSQSTKTTLHEIALPQPGFDVRAYKEQVLGLPDRGLACPLPRARTADEADQKEGEGPNALRGAHPRVKDGVKKGGVRAEADGDLSAYLGQQIPFNQLVALGALGAAGVAGVLGAIVVGHLCSSGVVVANSLRPVNGARPPNVPATRGPVPPLAARTAPALCRLAAHRPLSCDQPPKINVENV